MEIFALCVINAFLVEESEHHLLASPGEHSEKARIDRNNPRTSAAAFANKLKSMQLRRQDFPLTSIVATCPLILGLLDVSLGYANVLKPLFPSGQTTDSIEALLRPKELTDLMKKVSIAGQARTRLKSGTTKTARVAGGSEK